MNKTISMTLSVRDIRPNGQKWMLKLIMCMQTGISEDAIIRMRNYKHIITVGVNEVLPFLSTFTLYIACRLLPGVLYVFFFSFFPETNAS